MTFKQAVVSCFQKNYAGFTGRAPRSEYWFFILAYVLALVAAAFLGALLGGRKLAVIAGAIVALASFLPSLAAGVRRLHDTNSSGWWYLLALVPYVGGVIMLVWFCIPGTKGEYCFGLDPLNSTDVEAFQ